VLIAAHNADAAQLPAKAVLGFVQTQDFRLYAEAAVQGTAMLTIARPCRKMFWSALPSDLCAARMGFAGALAMVLGCQLCARLQTEQARNWRCSRLSQIWLLGFALR
jgi:hypothetical protein